MRVFNNVYVLNMRNMPLMPTTQAKANRLLQAGKAMIVKRFPFTIQLLYPTGESKQDINLGISTGYKTIGFSVISSKSELICGELELDNFTHKRLLERKMYRRMRRNRLWYRKSRFLNRGIKEGWLPPSVQRRYDTHLNLINRIKRILPISKVFVQVGLFDIQKIIDPEIQEINYQQGDLYGHQNVMQYLIARESGKCQYCKKKHIKGNPFRAHHIIQKKDGGTDSPGNLALAHKLCHDEIHRLNIKIKNPGKQYKEATFMNIIRKRFYKENFEITYGYKTYIDRNKLGLEKSHENDAFVISGGIQQNRCKSIEVIQKRRNNRCLQTNRKGYKPSIRRKRYKIQPGDLFWVDGKKYSCLGISNYGKQICYKQENKKIFISSKLIEKYFNFGSLIFK